MRASAFALLALLAACGRSESPPPIPETPIADTIAAPWFICDATNAPVLLVFDRDGAAARVAQYDKPNGALIQRTQYQIGDQEGATGSVYTSLMQDGAVVGAVRLINLDMLETPGAAFTSPYTSVHLGDRDLSCRWLPRTRLMGFTGRRTIVVSEDADGDLLYHSYDFASAAQAQSIDIAENGHTTTFSLEVRDGSETASAEGERYVFQADAGTQITISADRSGRGQVVVQRHGSQPTQTEDLVAYVAGAGPE